jgi:hypothetical protein
MMPLVPPIRVELDVWGEAAGDIAFGPGDQILVSERLKEASAGIVGFEKLERAEVIRVKSRKARITSLAPYFLGTVRRSAAAIDDEASGLIRETELLCPRCQYGGVIKRVARIALTLGTWSGEDVFIARGLPGIILASERFLAVCTSHQLKNCELVPASSYSTDFGTNAAHSPRAR